MNGLYYLMSDYKHQSYKNLIITNPPAGACERAREASERGGRIHALVGVVPLPSARPSLTSVSSPSNDERNEEGTGAKEQE